MAEVDEVLAKLDPAMLVVTLRAGDERAGCLVGFHSQSGIDPVRYAIWISKANRTFRFALTADVFALHLLRREDRVLAELFGETTGDDIDKFAYCAWTEGTLGVPLLDACPERVLARPVGLDDAGSDHVCFSVEPFEVHCSREAMQPLRYSDVRTFEAGHPPSDPPQPS